MDRQTAHILETIQNEFAVIVQIVESLSGLSSRWNGAVLLTDEVLISGRPCFRARKDWSCGLTVHVATIVQPQMHLTLVHEAFHSVSVGARRQQLEGNRGFEEGVVESLTRFHGLDILGDAGYPNRKSQAREQFDDFLEALESIRRVCRADHDTFYLGLLRTPLAERRYTVVKWACQTDPHVSESRMTARLSLALRRLS